MADTKWVTPAKFLKVNKGVIGRNLLYDMMRAGEIPHIRIGPKKILMPLDALDQIAERQLQDGE